MNELHGIRITILFDTQRFIPYTVSVRFNLIFSPPVDFLHDEFPKKIEDIGRISNGLLYITEGLSTLSRSNAEGVKKVDILRSHKYGQPTESVYVFIFIGGNLGEANLKTGCAQRVGLLVARPKPTSTRYKFTKVWTSSTFMCRNQRQEKF
jgi:hypothetical protein